MISWVVVGEYGTFVSALNYKIAEQNSCIYYFVSFPQ